jgi:7-cyano-7-deazaguanine synthase
MNRNKAVVLASGGIDSTTCLAIAKAEGFHVCALHVNYHQRHKIELDAARRVDKSLGVHTSLVLEVPLDVIGGSALTSNLAVPKGDNLGASGIPVTYVPARNTVLLSLALAWAEVLKAEDIFIGVNALDYSGYPDCRPAYIHAFQQMAELALKATVQGGMAIHIRTPLIQMSKKEIILTGIRLGIDYGLTLSCYDPDPTGLACGECASCLIRKRGFREAEITDPTLYRGN